MKPLVSILIPAYNAERWIAETVKSAIAQTWPRKEIIIVDDGSTDQTVVIARTFASKDVRVVSKDNQGAAATRNYALSLSQGDYLQWLDADDLLSQEKVTKQMEVAGECQDARTLLSSAWGFFSYRTDRAEFSPTSLWNDLSPVEWLLRKLSEGSHMQTATWLVSRELSDAAGPWDTRLLSDDDGEYFCRVITASNAIRFVPQSKVFYRVTPASRLSYIGQSDKKKDAMLLSMRLHCSGLARARPKFGWSIGNTPAAVEIRVDCALVWLESGQTSPICFAAAQGIYAKTLGWCNASVRSSRRSPSLSRWIRSKLIAITSEVRLIEKFYECFDS
jgi:glycosyltransferase involved in cell wall biosynthesis